MALRLSRCTLHCAGNRSKFSTLTPFLYPPTSTQFGAQHPGFFVAVTKSLTHSPCRFICSTTALRKKHPLESKAPEGEFLEQEGFLSVQQPHHPHSTYSSSSFTDLKVLTLCAGSGGNGCVSFLRDKFIPNGPANGGNGGTGGAIYIQAVYGETSLHKIARDGAVQAAAGRNGQGRALNGKRGDDTVVRVPVGTVVREISRWDPAVEELGRQSEYEEQYAEKSAAKAAGEEGEGELLEPNWRHGENEHWLHYPRSLSQNLQSSQFNGAAFPFNHHRSSSELLAQTHPTPVYLDLSEPTIQPILLLPGAPGGFGNPHFVSTELRRPKFATKGGKGARMKIQLELKILADVGLVGLPNAGKSSFLRSVSRKQARVGEWAFTTLSPNIGTIVLDERTMPPQNRTQPWEHQKQPRFTIADIPGLISDAHLNKGLGHGFLRHVERAKVLGFVLDLSRDDPVGDLKGLWREVKAYEKGEGGDEVGGNVKGMMSEMAGNTNIDIELMGEEEEGEGEEEGGGLDQELVEGLIGGREKEVEEGKHKEGDVETVLGNEGGGGSKVQMVRFPGVGALVPHKEAPRPPRKVKKEISDFELESLHLRQERPKMSSKPWFVIANKADLPGTEEKYWALKKHLEAEMLKRSDVKEIGLLPISALRGQGVDKVVDWMKGMLGF